MPPRLFIDPADAVLAAAAEFELPPAAARHAQVRRVQPGQRLQLFDGSGAEWPAEVLAMTRQAVRVRLDAPVTVDRELPCAVTLALAVPANDRMDALVEKATELGAAALQPLWTARSVLRLDGERAARRRSHWQAVAVAAAEQCGRARVPAVAAPCTLAAWLADGLPATAAAVRWALSLAPGAVGPGSAWPGGIAGPQGPGPAAVLPRALVLVSGPEGGLAPDEETSLRAAGFAAVTLGPRVLRADTAPLALLAWLAVQALPGNGTAAG